MEHVHMSSSLTCKHSRRVLVLKQKMWPKRLMDYGYDAPTMSWPVNGTLMIEPTDSESKGALHPALIVMADEWTKPYTRESAAFPAPWVHASKFWLTTGWVDNVFGDCNCVCTNPTYVREEREAVAA